MVEKNDFLHDYKKKINDLVTNKISNDLGSRI